MIAYIQGTKLQRETESLILNVHGVGYELHCSVNTLDRADEQDLVRLWVHTHVREDQLQLFGFATPAEKQLFLSLIKVNGIGPKMAVKILSATKTEALISMIDNGDVKALVQLPKVGKKTAEQIILSLKGKLVTDDEVGAGTFAARGEIVSALVNLGFKMGDVESVVNGMDPTIDLQQGLREGLSQLSAQF